MSYTMSTRNSPGEWLTGDDERILEGCYPCTCRGCSIRREAIAKALRIIRRQKERHGAGGSHVVNTTTENDRPDDVSLKG